MSVVEGSAAHGSGTGARPLGVILAVLILVAGFVVGSAGQSVVSLGAAADVSVSAAVIGAYGVAGESQPMRVSLQVGLSNSGDTTVRVTGGWSDTVTTVIRSVAPDALSLDAGAAGELTLDVDVRCTWPADLTLPALRVEAPNGEPTQVPLAGAQFLTQACAGEPDKVRPLSLVSASPVTGTGTGTDTGTGSGPGSGTGAARLDLAVLSRTGRPVQVRQIRAGGQELPMIQAGPVVASSVVTIGVLAPAGCPPSWQVMGIPSTVVIDLAGGAQIPLPIGPPLTEWLLQTTCPPSQTR